jgi:hypothetical protein
MVKLTDPKSKARTMPDCDFAQLASQIIITEQYGSRKLIDGLRTISPQGLARVLGRTPQIVEDRLNGKTAIRPIEARSIIAYTRDLRLAQWMLDGTPFLPALRPDLVNQPVALARAGLDNEAAQVHASAADLAHEASNLLQAAIHAVRDLTIDGADRKRLRKEIADVASALATLETSIAAPAKSFERKA